MRAAWWIGSRSRRLASVTAHACLGLFVCAAKAAPTPLPEQANAFIENYCASCHDDVEKKGGLDLTALTFQPGDLSNFLRWVKVHDRLKAGEMPPKEKKKRPDAAELETFVQSLSATLTAEE